MDNAKVVVMKNTDICHDIAAVSIFDTLPIHSMTIYSDIQCSTNTMKAYAKLATTKVEI